MKRVLTVYNLPIWGVFTHAIDLPKTEQAEQSHQGNSLLIPVQSATVIAQQLTHLPEHGQLMVAAIQAEHFLAAASEAGQTMHSAAAQWQQITTSLLAAQRQNRRRIQVFNLHQALSAPDPLNQLLETSNGLPAQQPPHTIELLAACQYLAQQPELQRLNTQLQAIALPIAANEQLTVDVEQVLLRHKTQIAQVQQQESDLKSAQAETEFMLLQLHQVQEELEQQHLKLQQQENTLKLKTNECELTAAKIQQLHAECAQQQVKLQQKDNELKLTTDAHKLTTAQVQQLQKELEQQHIKLQQQENALKLNADERELITTQLQYQQEELQNQQIKLQQKETELISQQNENELILLQLQQVQEELEQYNAQLQAKKTQLEKHLNKEKWLRENQNKIEKKLQTAQKQLAERNQALQTLNEEREDFIAQVQRSEMRAGQCERELKAEQQNNKHTLFAKEKQYAKELSKLERQLRQANARAASAEFSLKQAEQELVALKTSISWRFATPVRAIGKMVKKTDSAREELTQQIGLLLTSEYFDVEWYLRTYKDVAENNINPAEHYLLFGAKEGRLPGPLFDGNWYLQQYPDVAKANINPLLHFITHGQQEGRSSSPILLKDNSQNKTGEKS